jgi:hypothetical protein
VKSCKGKWQGWQGQGKGLRPPRWERKLLADPKLTGSGQLSSHSEPWAGESTDTSLGTGGGAGAVGSEELAVKAEDCTAKLMGRL